ncbi:MAG: hypothetical protein NTW30_03125 [Candidatus Aenigmarchaeota archaeon]|nr:hypothetical protein [Candidatus Aenigmarchaeota archaeon]
MVDITGLFSYILFTLGPYALGLIALFTVVTFIFIRSVYIAIIVGIAAGLIVFVLTYNIVHPYIPSLPPLPK